MKCIGSILVMLAAGVWLGGIVSIAIYAGAVFKLLGPEQRDLAGTVTSRLFVLFGPYQLACGCVALVGSFIVYLAGRRKMAMALFIALALASLGAVYYHQFLVPQMEGLRAGGQSNSESFQKLHHLSRGLLTGMGVLLILALGMLPATLRGEAKK